MQGVNNKYLLVVRLLEETFRSRNILKDNFVFAIDTVVSLNLSDELLSQFVIVACKKTNTGMFALTYGSRLDEAIKSQNKESLITLVASPFFPELFENTDLDDF